MFRFLSYATDLSDGGKDSISGQRSGLNVEQGPTLLSNIIGERTVTSRWEVMTLHVLVFFFFARVAEALL